LNATSRADIKNKEDRLVEMNVAKSNTIFATTILRPFTRQVILHACVYVGAERGKRFDKII